MRNVLKNKKGMTLIEIVVGSLLFSMVVITVSAVLAPMMTAYMRANNIAEYNTLMDNIGNMIVSDIAQASEVTPGNPLVLVIQGTEVYYTVENGILQRGDSLTDPYDVFPSGYYRGKAIDFNVEQTPPGYTVSVTVSSPGGGVGASSAVLTRDYAVRPLLINP